MHPAKLVDFEPTLKVGKVWSTGVGKGLDKCRQADQTRL